MLYKIYLKRLISMIEYKSKLLRGMGRWERIIAGNCSGQF